MGAFCVRFGAWHHIVLGGLAFGAGSLTDARAAEIAADGSTPTHVSVDVAGKATVNLAPANAAGISHNSYSAFNVPAAGVDLDNRSVSASLILNEVTGASISTLTGPLQLLGPAAHVVIANPNGIRVDGGRFINTGGVILTTGIPSVGADGLSLTTTDGRIEVSGAGLSLDGPSLDLIAKAVEISGAINGGAAQVAISAGDATHRVDPSAAIADAADLVQQTRGSSRSRSDVAVTVSGGAVLKGGAIRVKVTDAGAGVRMAANAEIGGGGFRVTADGTITLTDSSINAKGAIALKGGKVAVRSDTVRTNLKSSDSGLSIQATRGGIEVKGAALAGRQRETSSFAFLGGVALDAAGDILISRSAANEPVSLAVDADDLALTSGGSILGDGLAAKASGSLLMSGVNGINQTELSASVLAANVISSDIIRFAGINLDSTNGIRLQGAGIDLAGHAGRADKITSRAAGVTLLALDGDIANAGVAIEGAAETGGDGDSTGGVTMRAPGTVRLSSLDGTALGQFTSLSGLLKIEAGADLLNSSGLIASNGSVDLKAGGRLVNQTVILGGSRGSDRVTGGPMGLGSRSEISTDHGSLLTDSQRATISAGDTLTISTRGLDNLGAIMTGTRIAIDLQGSLDNRSLVTGRSEFRRRCFFFCSATGWSNVALVEARISAAETLTVHATDTVETSGALLVAGQDLHVVAPRFIASSVLMPQIVLRSAGIGGLFGGRDGWFGQSYTGGLITSSFGTLDIAAADIETDGVALGAGGQVKLSAKPKERITPEGAGPAHRLSTGATAGVRR